MDFRLYFMDGHNHVEKGLDLEYATVDAAIRAVASYADGRPMELWRRAKRIKLFT